MAEAYKKSEDASREHPRHLYKTGDYPKNEMSTPAATAEPITPEMLLDIQ